MEQSTGKEQLQGSSSSSSTVTSCFLLEALRGFCQCLGIEFGSDKPEENSSTSETNDGGDKSKTCGCEGGSEDPSSTDPPVDPPPATSTDDPVNTNLSGPQKPPVSGGSGGKIN